MLNSTIFQNLRSDFWGTLLEWQKSRFPWLLLAGTALALEIFSWSVFQNLLGLRPCELCVFIRFSMLAICVAGLVGAICPKSAILRLVGYGLAFWWIIKGLMWSARLHVENIRASDPDWISSCGDGAIRFPFGLKLDQWLPGHFAPQALCGEDSAWALLGLSMPQWLFFVYGCFIVVLLLMVFAWAKQSLFPRKP